MMKKLLCTFLLAFLSFGFIQAQADVNITGNGITITSGDTTPDLSDHTSFGQVSVGSTLTRTYTIQNTGDTNLNLLAFGFGFGSDPQFSINTSATTSPIAPGGSTTIGITFTPTSTGVTTAVVSISTSDPDENPYTFTVGAEGITASTDPDINIQGNSNDIVNGSATTQLSNHTDFGSVVVGSSVTRTYTVQNTGGADLNLTLLGFGFGTNPQFSINTSGTTSPISGGGSTTFSVTFTPTAAGAATGTVSISSNDSDENPYTFAISALGVDSPDINLQGNGNNIANGSAPDITNHTDFGNVSVGTTLTRTFTIQNTGNENLNLTLLGFGFGTDPQYSINTASTTSPVAAGGTTTFTVTFTPTSIGVATGLVSISSNDPDENPYTFNITANAVGVADINLQGNGNDIVNGSSSPLLTNHTDFGDVSVGSSLTRTFTIQNTGDENLTLTLIGFGFGTNPQYTINTSGTTSPIAGGGGTTTFSVTFTPTASGVANGTVSITSNDSDESPYTFAITANGVVDNQPEINLLDNSNANLASGGTVNFGSQNVPSGSQTFTFTIQNLGTTDLNLTNPSPFVTISGVNASDFTLGTIPSATISASGSTTFTITFDPSALGVRTANVSIANNDSDENPYTFTVTGEGIDANAGTPLLITQYYENGNNDYIEIKNVSSNFVPPQFFLCLYTDLSTITSVISTSAPSQSIQIPALAAGQVIVFRNPSASPANGTPTNVCTFTGNDVVLISTSNGTDAYAGRIDIVGVVGNGTPPIWGANISYIKGCGTNESPSTTFGYEVGSNTVTDYIKLTTSEVDTALAGTNLSLGTQTIGPTTWTSSWNNGIPDKTKNTIINGLYGAGSFESCNLTINSGGAINLTGTDFVKVNDDLAINGSFTMGDQAALITVDESATITGVVSKQESTTTLKQYDFTYWSSPVQGASTSVFTGSGAPADRIFEWRKPVSGNYGGWQAKSGALETARGYISEGPDGATQHNVTFTGAPNNGVLSIAVGFDNTIANGGGGFNLVGNPYPCAIDINKFISLGSNDPIKNNDNTDGTIWLWTHNTAFQDNPGENADYVTNDYATYNLSGGTAAASGGAAPTYNIGSSQGFFVKAKNSGPIFFTNEMKLDGENTQFFRGNETKKSKQQVRDRMWLDLKSKKGGAFSQILVGFFKEATDGEDRGYDGVKFSAGNYISLYSKIGDDKYAIQGLGSYSSDKKVAIGFDSYIKEKFTISINKLEGVLESENIYLVDNYLNVVHDLKASDYEFEVTEKGSYADRFTLQFTKSVLSSGSEELENNFIVSNEDNTLRVRASNSITKLKVYDMLGRLLIDEKPNKSDYYLNTDNISNGSVLILNAVLENGAEVSKKAIKF